jgi:hypothetical protein
MVRQRLHSDVRIRSSQHILVHLVPAKGALSFISGVSKDSVRFHVRLCGYKFGSSIIGDGYGPLEP